MEWDRIGRLHGFNNHKHYRPSDLKAMEQVHRTSMEAAIFAAAKALGRPTVEFPGKDFVRRNWFQAVNADAIYAISRIVGKGDLDKGFPNNSGKQIVSGGTAWACEMAIQMGKPVFVFNMKDNQWYEWNETMFVECNTPILTEKYAGIGSREIDQEAKKAIEDVYIKTLEHDRNNV
jgi:hypothetical protein